MALWLFLLGLVAASASKEHSNIRGAGLDQVGSKTTNMKQITADKKMHGSGVPVKSFLMNAVASGRFQPSSNFPGAASFMEKTQTLVDIHNRNSAVGDSNDNTDQQTMATAVADILHEELAVGGSSDVDVFIGTAGHGHVFPGATVPFGMVQATPFLAREGEQNWDGLSGYHRDAQSKTSPLVGFGHTALSGVGIGDGGDVILLPWAGSDPESAGGRFGPTATLFHNAGEHASPGYYTAELGMPTMHKPAIRAEVTAGMRHAVHRYTWLDDSQQRRLLVNLGSTVDHTHDGKLTQLSNEGQNSVFAGYRRSGGAISHKVAFHFEMDAPASALHKLGSHIWAIDLPPSTSSLTVRLGLSHNDEDNAKRNLRSEKSKSSGASLIQGLAVDFDATKEAAAQRWHEVLGRMKITGSTELRRRMYTALYHAMMGPTRFDDAEGSSGQAYTTYSLWDSYRSTHPLLNLVVPEMSDGFAQSLVQSHDKNGGLPLWELWGTNTGWMVGAPAAIVLSEMVLKNLTEPSKPLYNAVTSLLETGNDPSKNRVAEGMERAIAASCVEKVASRIGDKAGSENMAKLAKSYQNFWDPDTKMFWGGQGQGAGNDANGEDSRFIEGTAWQYSFLVPHDVKGLVSLLGGKEQLEQRLDTLFYSLPEAHMNFKIPDIENGNLGGATIGNEPDMHVPYLYNYAGVPWKAQRALDRLEEFFTARRDGIPGNDDVGALSSWFLWSALGLYPVDVCSAKYEIGRPLVHKAEISVGPQNDKKTLTISTFRNPDWILDGKHHDKHQPIGPEDRYVQNVWWNGNPVRETSMRHEDLIQGGELKFQMGFDPNPNWPNRY